MPTPTCSKCNRVIPSDDINVANDVAYCRPCNLAFKLSELTRNAELDANLKLNNPPPGAWYFQDGMSTIVGATNRSWGAVLGILVFGLFWNSIVSIFVLLAISSTMQLLHLPIPHWFPAPKMDGSPMGSGGTIFLWLFLTPFIVIGLSMIGTFFFLLVGKTEVRIHNDQGTVFTGVGSVGLRRRFNPKAIKETRILNDEYNNGQPKVRIVLETREGKLIKFGTMLREDRKKFVAGAVRHAVAG
jgi:hypothetical protein